MKEITIRRAKHDKENPFVMVSKSMIRDINLSLKSRAALSYMLSYPDDWITHPRKLADDLGIGKDQVYKILKELIESGYCQRVEKSKVNGRFTGSYYEFSELKQFLPRPDFQDAVIQDAENKDTTNKDTSTYVEVKNKKENTQEGARVSFGSHVKLTKDQFASLESNMTKHVLDNLIEEVNDWCAQQGITYKDYSAAIRNFHRRRQKKSNTKIQVSEEINPHAEFLQALEKRNKKQHLGA